MTKVLDRLNIIGEISAAEEAAIVRQDQPDIRTDGAAARGCCSRLGENPGTDVDAVAIPIRVLKEETRRPERLRDRSEDREDEQRMEPARRYVDPELAALYEEPTFVKRREEVAWKDERPHIKRAVVLGAPVEEESPAPG
jgi:hypothetical protein